MFNLMRFSAGGDEVVGRDGICGSRKNVDLIDLIGHRVSGPITD
jgi:hypothetical protein